MSVLIREYLKNFEYSENNELFLLEKKTNIESISVSKDISVPKYINEFWTSKQRQANSIHEISYRACFKAQLPNFFIKWLTNKNDIVFDPFSGRGTTVIEAALNGRNVISNDINPISEIFTRPRLNIPLLNDITKRLDEIQINMNLESDIDLSMFYHNNTLMEILSIKNYLKDKQKNNIEDYIDSWIRMVATNRLTGHSNGFFSVYTLPPNQAVSQKSQLRINKQRNQVPEYRNAKTIIIKKSRDLLRDINNNVRDNLGLINKNALFLSKDAAELSEINTGSVKLTVTSPPFLDIVQYADDNWLRCWFNNINVNEVNSKITMSKTIEQWVDKMTQVFNELFRITKPEGFVVFEVGEIRNGKLRLDEYVLKIANSVGFKCEAVMINEQIFTKTSNIWGINNNNKGTNSNRIVILKK